MSITINVEEFRELLDSAERQGLVRDGRLSLRREVGFLVITENQVVDTPPEETQLAVDLSKITQFKCLTERDPGNPNTSRRLFYKKK